MKSADDSKNDSILMIAAEASSCMYAKNLMDQWKRDFPEAHFFGVGDKEMSSKGMNCFGFAEDMAVVGLQEVIKHYGAIKKVADDILAHVEKHPPKFAILLDYPGFNLRLAKKLKAMDIPVVYYISPQLWAWKKGRVKQVKQFVDEMLVVFPFEVDFYKNHNMESHFVGHPLVEVVESERKDFFWEHSKQILGLMPGSRKSEIQHNFKSQLGAALKLREKYDLDIKVLLAPTLKVEDFEPYLDGKKVDFLKGKPTQMIQACDFIISASGTATLQVALCEKPMIVMYRMNPITAFIAKLLVRSVKSFCIVNLIAGEKVVPELFQNQANEDGLAKTMGELIEDEILRDKMIQDLRAVKTKLGHGGATQNVVSFLKKRFYA